MSDWGGKCFKAVTGERHYVQVGGSKIRFDRGDTKVAVYWYKKLAGVSEGPLPRSCVPLLSRSAAPLLRRFLTSCSPSHFLLCPLLLPLKKASRLGQWRSPPQTACPPS